MINHQTIMLKTKKINIEYVEAGEVREAIRTGIADALQSNEFTMQVMKRIALDFCFYWGYGKHNPSETEFDKWLQSDRGKQSLERAIAFASMATKLQPQEHDKQ